MRSWPRALHARTGAEPTNGDGFGSGLVRVRHHPALYRSVSPPRLMPTSASVPATPSRRCSWRTCGRRSARRFSRSTATLSSRRWLFVHNGFLADFHTLRERAHARDRPGAVRTFRDRPNSCAWTKSSPRHREVSSIWRSPSGRRPNRGLGSPAWDRRCGAGEVRLIASEPVSDLPVTGARCRKRRP